MSYEDLTRWMFNLERFGIKLGLENVTEFLSRIGNPQHELKSVHVTGTNGKGSVCAFISEILQQHGMKVGLYTSPHLVDFRERIRINGEEIPEEEVVRLGLELRSHMESMASEDGEKQLTFFEFTTGLAFKYFNEQKVDMVVAEVGMGGRLDATNVLIPEVAVITRIGLEHTNYLGSTIPQIAREKAGIIKGGASVITCEKNNDALSVIRTACEKKGARLRMMGVDFDIDNAMQSIDGTRFDYSGERNLLAVDTRLLGKYQAENAAAAIAVIEELSKRGIAISDQEIRDGIKSTRGPGRLDIVSRRPLVIFDGSHNPDGVRTTLKVLTDLEVTPLTFVLGCMDDKDARGIVKAVVPSAAKIICTRAAYKRALPVDKLAAIVGEEFRGERETLEDAVQAFRRGTEDISGKGMCVIGSLYLVGEAIKWWGQEHAEKTEPQKV
jgi:dihydrofolate synthase/folylpolyglutamate synthase